MVRVAIVEDDPAFMEQLKTYLQQYGLENGTSFQITAFTDGDEIVEKYKAEYDIILMDIQMRFMDGMSAAEEIRRADEEVTIIFITNMPQFAIRGYRVSAMDYIVKPIGYYAFSQSIGRALRHLRSRQDKYLVISVRSGKVKLAVSDIRFIEVFDHDLVFHTLQGDLETKGTMNAVEKELEGEPFFKCNKGCLVNLRYVDSLMGNDIQLGQDRLQVSRSRKKGLMDALNDYMESMGV